MGPTHAHAALEKSGAVVALGTSSSLFRFAFSAAQRSRFGIGIGKEESGRARPVAGPGRSSPLSAPAYPYPYRRTMSSSSSSAAVPPPPPSSPPPADEGRPAEADDRVASLVDRFLVEALENPRHRLMVLRMELDIQKFMQNHQLHEFEFQQFPNSYHRCAAHRVAQHYGLVTVADSLVDGPVSRIVARKTPESKYPAIALSEVPIKQARNDIEAAEKLKFVICQRPKASQNGAGGAGTNNGAVKTVEERIDDYNKARARIFNGSIPADVEGPSDFGALSIGRNELMNVEPSVYENKGCTLNSRSRVAVFKDAEKDRIDPDYDRNYKRYVRPPVPDFSVSPGAFSFAVPQFMQYGVGYMQSPSMPRNQPSVYYGQPDLSMGSSGTAVYPQWPTPAMMYPHCYDNLGHVISQVPVYQSFNHG